MSTLPADLNNTKKKLSKKTKVSSDQKKLMPLFLKPSQPKTYTPQQVTRMLYSTSLITAVYIAINAVAVRVLNDERSILKLILFGNANFAKILSSVDFFISFFTIFVALEYFRHVATSKLTFERLFHNSFILYILGEVSYSLLFFLVEHTPQRNKLMVLVSAYVVTNIQKFVLEFQTTLFLQRFSDLVLSPRLAQYATEHQSHSVLKSRFIFIRQTLVFLLQAVIYYLVGLWKIPLSILQLKGVRTFLFTFVKLSCYTIGVYVPMMRSLDNVTAEEMVLQYKSTESSWTFVRTVLSTGLTNSTIEKLIVTTFILLSLIPKSYLRLLETLLALHGLRAMSATLASSNYSKVMATLFTKAANLYLNIYVIGLGVSVGLSFIEYLWVNYLPQHIYVYNLILIFSYPIFLYLGDVACVAKIITTQRWIQFYSILNIVLRMTVWREFIKAPVHPATRELLPQKIEQLNEFLLMDLFLSFIIYSKAINFCSNMMSAFSLVLLLGTTVYYYMTKEYYLGSKKPIRLTADLTTAV